MAVQLHTQEVSTPTIFSFESRTVRTHADTNGELWFCATDVCDVLGYRNARDATAKHCREKGVAKRDTLTDGGKQELVYINEPNLYRLIVKSRKPEAERFEAWVMEDVLPTIRKTGAYSTTHRTKVEPGSYLLTAGEVHHLHGVFCMVDMMRETLRELEPPLRLLNAPIASRVFGGSHEISLFLNSLQKLRGHCDEYYRIVERRVLGH